MKSFLLSGDMGKRKFIQRSKKSSKTDDHKPFIPVQAKMLINQPNDAHEVEADKMADNVVSSKADGATRSVSPVTPSITPVQLQKASDKEDAVSVQSKEQHVASATATKITGAKSSGRPLEKKVKNTMENSFGADFSKVRVHTGVEAEQMSEGLNAQAFTHENNVFFNRGKYNPETREGKHLLAHELTHTLQQKGSEMVQRKHVADTGWRYTPPKAVSRSIIEIQGIVNATPDGVYGLDTKNAVENYQKVLKANGLYTDVIDGKWGENTDIAHVAFALRAPKRRDYNCAGFAFKKFFWINKVPTQSILSGMKKLSSSSQKTSPYHYKFWFWDVNVSTRNVLTGRSSAISSDFHIVGGQTDSKGEGPTSVMSKNGERPVEGPKPPLDWEVKTGPAIDQNGIVMPSHQWVIHSSRLGVFSSKELP
jgi:hypothetical protein